MTSDKSRAYWVDLCMATQFALRDPSGLAGFMVSHARLPRIDDERRPWSFRGWLLPYVMDLVPIEPGSILKYRHGRVGRWGYWLRIRETGEIPMVDPPQINFGLATLGSGSGSRQLARARDYIGETCGWGSSTSTLVEWLAWGLGVSDEPARGVDEKLSEWLYREFDVCPLLDEPADYLGWLLSESKGRGRDPVGFFPTPMGVCMMMKAMVLGGDREPGSGLFETVNDPCVGTGAMLLAASNHSLRLSGQDIVEACCKATLVQGALFAPWLAFPLIPPTGDLPEFEIETRSAVETSVVETVDLPAEVDWQDDGQARIFAR